MENEEKILIQQPDGSEFCEQKTVVMAMSEDIHLLPRVRTWTCSSVVEIVWKNEMKCRSFITLCFWKAPEPF